MLYDTLASQAGNINKIAFEIEEALHQYAFDSSRSYNEVEVATAVQNVIYKLDEVHDAIHTILDKYPISQATINKTKVPIALGDETKAEDNFIENQDFVLSILINSLSFPLTYFEYNYVHRLCNVVFYRPAGEVFFRVERRLKPFLVRLIASMLAKRLEGIVIRNSFGICVQLSIPRVIIEVERKAVINWKLSFSDWILKVIVAIHNYSTMRTSIPKDLDGIKWW